MKARARIAALSLALMPALGAVASAQTSAMHFGPQIAYDFDIEEIGLGAQFSLPIARRLEFYPSFMWYFIGEGSLWNLNADLKYRVASSQPHWLYVGTGLNISRFTNDGAGNTDAGLNLFAGAESLKGRIHPFGEVRLIIGDGSRFQIGAGLNITLSSH
jgi:hypothetical protein